MSELELEGDEDICTQELKLLRDNANEPEQVVFEVLVVIEVVSIASEKVTKMFSLIETSLWVSVGEVDKTVGAVVSVVPVAVYSSSSSLQEMIVRLKHKISKK